MLNNSENRADLAQIKKIISDISPISDDGWKNFSSMISFKTYKTNEYITRAGEVENYLYIILKGAVRLYITKGEKDLTFDFAFHSRFLNSYDSYITREKSVTNLQTLLPTKVAVLHRNDLEMAYQHEIEASKFGKMAAELIYLAKAKREMSLLLESPEERYLNLFEEQPHLIQEVPLKYLASYIGVTPQALSRIRKRIS